MNEQTTVETWYVGKTGNHQGLVISEADGRNVAVTYDSKDAPLVASAPALLEALRALLYEFQSRTALIETCDMADSELAAVKAAEQAIYQATEVTP